MRWCIAAGHRTDDPAGPALAAALPRQTTQTKHLASLPHDRGRREHSPKLETTVAGRGRPRVVCLRFLAATAARSGEARFATWAEIDLEHPDLDGPRRPHQDQARACVVPLSTAALAALDEARQYSNGSNGSGPVFPAPGGRALSNGAMSRLTQHLGVHAPRAAGLVPVVGGRDRGSPGRSPRPRWRTRAGALERAYQRSDLLAARREVMEAWSRHIS